MGQIGSAMGDPNTFAPDPSGFSGSDWAARFMGGAAKGLGQGLQNQKPPQQGGGMTPVASSPQPPVDLPTSGVQMGGGNDMRKRNPFFYGGQ